MHYRHNTSSKSHRFLRFQGLQLPGMPLVKGVPPPDLDQGPCAGLGAISSFRRTRGGHDLTPEPGILPCTYN